ncbi:hypothetical protein GCM10010218_28600 [Streptomyces mashuensis]|uniref:Heparin binding hemagglutinin HbhA n=1 Tax=Streptomyces mashuensis TaxID=33904 RepID=A0A919B2E6_9ACTN|nr:hypothetical protein [Streptomyces mashuensis]GHF45671.1 hypothetical protein GCM10010218_28600 [Streptomyces mashuensis]
MALTQDIRKAATDTGYAAAGAVDLAAEKVGQLVAEAPGRIEQLRSTDPKAVGERVTQQAKEVQERVGAKVTEFLASLDTDLKKLGQNAQDLALQGVGQAVGLAAKGGEKFEQLAERGRTAVKTWRGEAAEEISEIAVAVEPGSDTGSDAKSEQSGQGDKAEAAKADTKAGDKAEDKADDKADDKPAARRTTAARKAPAAKKTGE